jgi:hypothetical protein
MGHLSVVSPVPPSLALEFAGGAPFRRKVMIHQTRHFESMAVSAGGTPIVIASLHRARARRAELAIAFRPAAAAHMRALIRLAQWTLRRLAETGVLVFTRIAPGERQAQRMARLTGFVPGRFADPQIWIWKERKR